MNRTEQKAKTEFEKHAKETLKVEQIADSLYAFGSELACLRLGHMYRYCGDKSFVGYSKPRKTWFFRLEIL